MSIFAKPLAAQEPRTRDSQKISILYAAILVVMAVAQLYTYEDFVLYIRALGLPFSMQVIYLVTPILVLSEVFAIPFLLRMWLSPAFRYVSMFFGWLVAGIWLFLSLWIVLSNAPVDSVGFLGTVATLPPGIWAIFISLALGILAAWSSWGLWPRKQLKK